MQRGPIENFDLRNNVELVLSFERFNYDNSLQKKYISHFCRKTKTIVKYLVHLDQTNFKGYRCKSGTAIFFNCGSVPWQNF